MSERGSIAPIAIGLLMLLLILSFAMASIGHATVQATRIQHLADAAALYVNDRAKSQAHANELAAKMLEASGFSNITDFEVALGNESAELKVCARWVDPLRLGLGKRICRVATAKLFAVS